MNEFQTATITRRRILSALALLGKIGRAHV